MDNPVNSARILGTLVLLAVASLEAQGADPLPIVEGDVWTYFKGTVEPPADWNTITFNDSAWDSGPSGIGYGDGDDATVLSDMEDNYRTVYARREFDVPSASAVPRLTLYVDFDDGFVAYLNGTEVARVNVIGTPPAHDTSASASREAGSFDAFVLDAYVGDLVDGTNVLAVQGHNRTLGSSDFSLIPRLELSNTPPDPPVIDTPFDGESGVPANPLLCVDVSDSNGENLDVTFYGVDASAPPAADFTVIAIPDTQFAAESYPEVFEAETQWIVDNRVARNIVFATHLGDCVQTASVQLEWDRADTALSLLEDPVTTLLPDGMAWGMAPGNHDQFPADNARSGGDESSTTALYNQTFGLSRFQARSYYGGRYDFGDPVQYPENNDNNFQLFSAEHYGFIIFHLEYDNSDNSVRSDVLAWMDSVLDANLERRAMITTHYMINGSATFSNQGQAIYDEVKDNSNVFLMLGGHSAQGAIRSDTFQGHTVHTVLGNYQVDPNGGNGWLRILTFSPQNNEIQIETYSPWLDQFRTGAPHEFLIAYDMDNGLPFAQVGGTVTAVPSGGNACVSWPGRQVGGAYQWLVTVSDGTSTTEGPTWTFTSDGSCFDAADCDDNDVFTTDQCLAGFCTFATDSDADGVSDASDCESADDQVWQTPGEALNLRPGTAVDQIEWDAPADTGATSVRYDTIRSTNPADFGAGATCVESDDGSDTLATDTQLPAVGGAFYFVVRAENDCPGAVGQGDLGSDSLGAPRVGRDCP